MFDSLTPLILSVSLLAGLSIFSAENITAGQYQLDADTEIAAARAGNDEPIVPGQGRQETSAEKS